MAAAAGPGNGPVQAPLSPEGIRKFEEGVNLIFSRWTALQMAIQNEWGGRNSRDKAQQMVLDIVQWLAHSTGTRYIDELEEMLDENMLLSFSTELEDGSSEEVAEQLMILHEECLQGNYDMISKLQGIQPSLPSTSQSKKVSEDSDDESSDSDHELVSEMDIDSNSNNRAENGCLSTENGSTTNNQTQAEIDDGWTVVPSRRKKGHQKT